MRCFATLIVFTLIFANVWGAPSGSVNHATQGTLNLALGNSGVNASGSTGSAQQTSQSVASSSTTASNNVGSAFQVSLNPTSNQAALGVSTTGNTGTQAAPSIASSSGDLTGAYQSSLNINPNQTSLGLNGTGTTSLDRNGLIQVSPAGAVNLQINVQTGNLVPSVPPLPLPGSPSLPIGGSGANTASSGLLSGFSAGSGGSSNESGLSNVDTQNLVACSFVISQQPDLQTQQNTACNSAIWSPQTSLTSSKAKIRVTKSK